MSESLRLPDAERLLDELTAKLRGSVTRETAMVGIHTGGVWLAERLHSALGLTIPLGSLDPTFYRDDFGTIGLHRRSGRSEIPFDVAGRDVILVDDVLYTGRTIRAAMNELFDYGRPAGIRLAVLVDRHRRELPICAQFCGAELAVPDDSMLVLARDPDGRLSLALELKR